MSFPIRHVHSPSPLQQRCWPSPPASDEEWAMPKSPRESCTRRKSMDLAYFPVVTNVVGSNDSFATTSIDANPSQMSHHKIALAWATLRVRYPVLASVGLVDSSGNVSFAHDGFSNPSSAIVDAETSLEFRHDNSPAEVVSSYLAGIRRVSRSHLSHLYISSTSSDALTRPLTPPISNSDDDLGRIPNFQYTFLLCTPHYVADKKVLVLWLEELVSLLLSNTLLSENDVQLEISRAQMSHLALQNQKPDPHSPIRASASPIKVKLPLAGRFQRTAVAVQEVVCR